MRSSSLLLTTLSLALLAVPASASTIDDFLLVGEGNVITFSLPSSPVAIPSVGAGGVIAGFYVTGSTPVVVDGSPGTASLEFLSGQIFVGPGLLVQSSLGNFTVVGSLLYSGTAANPTFNTETFDLRDFYGPGLPYSPHDRSRVSRRTRAWWVDLAGVGSRRAGRVGAPALSAARGLKGNWV